MTLLTVHPDDQAGTTRTGTRDPETITAALRAIGVTFERWRADVELPAGADQATVLAAYDRDVQRLMAEGGYRTVDVVRVTPDHPDRAAMRQRFLAEHVHDDDEVRFFVEGSGAFHLHASGQVFRVVCERGDLIRVPAGTTHWFDMGPRPHFCAIRLFTTPDGWVGRFTGSDVASSFPPYDP